MRGRACPLPTLKNLRHCSTETMKCPILLGLASAALFGVSTPLAKLLVGTTPPLWLAALLYLGAGLGLVTVVAIRRLVRPRRQLAMPSGRDWRWFGGAIVLGGVVGPVALTYGLTTTGGAVASPVSRWPKDSGASDSRNG